MASKILSDNKYDLEISRHKKILDAMIRDAQSFMSSYLQLPAKDRALALKQIQSQTQQLQKFVSQPVHHEMTNAGTKFAFDSLKNSFNSFTGRWRKFENSMS